MLNKAEEGGAECPQLTLILPNPIGSSNNTYSWCNHRRSAVSLSRSLCTMFACFFSLRLLYFRSLRRFFDCLSLKTIRFQRQPRRLALNLSSFILSSLVIYRDRIFFFLEIYSKAISEWSRGVCCVINLDDLFKIYCVCVFVC